MNTVIENKKKRFRKITASVLILLASLVLVVFLLFKISPWPSALLIRKAFNKEAVKVNTALKKYTPENIQTISNFVYDPNDPDALLDIYYPTDTPKGKKWPVIVWIHGGGWVSGNKSLTSNYYKILASKGFAVVSIDYTLAPEKQYPTPVKQSMKALEYLSENQNQFPIDTFNFILAGDSGGAHIAAQTANIICNTDYAELIKISPSLQPNQLTALLVYCGPYNTQNINLKGTFGEFLKTVLWSYSGYKDFTESPDFATANIIAHITKNFPPAFISVGNNDPLQSHSYELASKLKSDGVSTKTLFFNKNHIPKLNHEYQFNLDLDASKKALDESIVFLLETVQLKMNTKNTISNTSVSNK
ncbi:alpha/beta hydrolase [Flavobacterium sp.]|uniref:alpha/beta hydrolase n=1 Tax=Flavobacterium sp. TaxID=239 RepID=UPI003D6AAAA3